MIDGLTNADALPVLERLMQFTGQRQRLIANNIANLSTPGFRPADVSVAGFQDQLRAALDRRSKPGIAGGSLELKSTNEVEISEASLVLHPEPLGGSPYSAPEIDHSVERTMQGLVENFMMFRTAAQLLRSRLDVLNIAIRERF